MGGTAMTFERSEGKPRLQRARLRDVSTPLSADDKPRRIERRPHRTANRSLLLMARQAAGEAMGSVGSDLETPPAPSQLAREALRLFRALVRELGTSSPTARTHALAYAMQTAAAMRLTIAADAAGLDTQRGLELLEQAAKCQARAERSATAAIALAGLLKSSRPKAPPAPWLEAADDDEGPE